MENSIKDMPHIVRKGIFNLVTTKATNSDKVEDSEKLIEMETALATFEDYEIAMIRKEYECLNSTPREIAEKISSEVIGQEEAIKKVVHVAYYNQMANFIEELGYDSFKRINVILIGPTGCGKTSTVKALKKYFKVPVITYSSDSITSAGYIGNKVEDILIRLFEEAKQDLALAERGIIFIDEIDKKREEISSAGKDVNGKAVQEELLKILEPSKIDLTLANKKRVPFDTSRLTVILGGAFVGIEDIRKKRLHKKTLGFKNGIDEMSEEEINASEYIPQDIIDFGFIPEFVGRILMIDEFRKLTEDDIMKIMLYGMNSPYRENTRLLANFLNVDMYVSKKFLERISERTIEAGTGARSLESKIANVFYPIREEAYENMGQDSICEIQEDGSYIHMYDTITYYGILKI